MVTDKLYRLLDPDQCRVFSQLPIKPHACPTYKTHSLKHVLTRIAFACLMVEFYESQPLGRAEVFSMRTKCEKGVRERPKSHRNSQSDGVSISLPTCFGEEGRHHFPSVFLEGNGPGFQGETRHFRDVAWKWIGLALVWGNALSWLLQEGFLQRVVGSSEVLS